MKFDPNTQHRRSIRLKGYDYTQAGAYFITICSQNRECLFGEIAEGEMHLSAAGNLIQTVWNQIPAYYPGIDIAEFVVMPNHIHGIIIIVGAGPRACPDSMEPQNSGQPQGVAPTGVLSLPDMVHRFKTMTTKRYADGVKQSGWPPFPGRLWQRNYWEHVIRNESDYLRISEYIHNNPARWAQDRLNPKSPDPVGAGPRACPDSMEPQNSGQPQGVAPTVNKTVGGA